MIHLDQLSFGYRKGQLLFNKLNLHLEAGHIYGLLGKNGAGKSSLLRNIAGLLYPNEGSINVAGFSPRKRQPAFLQQIYFVPEEIYLPAVTIAKYLAVQAPFYPKFDKSQFRYYLTEFDVPFDSRISNLSFGQRKKVLIAFALACNTNVLIMDEPTNGLDIPSKKQVRKLLASALRENQLMLISTHQVRDLDNLIDSVIMLEDRGILLHQSLHRVSEQLRFATLSKAENDHRVLYSEPSLQGYTVVMENLEQQDSKVDLERLFNAATQNPERIRQLFN
ncbi:MAG: ABC transporter ATP-binding protein [Bacteroidota bacterium]